MATKTATDVDKQIGIRLRVRRQTIQMSQTALAEAVGVTFQQVQKYEKGANRIGASRLAQLAEALEVPVAYFFEGLDGTAAAPDFLSDPQIAKLLSAFRAIESDDVRHAIVDVVQLASGTLGAPKATGNSTRASDRNRARSDTVIPSP